MRISNSIYKVFNLITALLLAMSMRLSACAPKEIVFGALLPLTTCKKGAPNFTLEG
jgi:hypothetical protein